MSNTIPMEEHFLPILYSRNMRGELIVWKCKVAHYSEVPTIVVTTGRVGERFKKTSTMERIAQGKNIGKSNETTPLQQAKLQAKSRWDKQIKNGYRVAEAAPNETLLGRDETAETETYVNFLETVIPANRLDANDRFKPMKCQKYYKDKEKTKIRITFPCIGQPKINGFRAVAEQTDLQAGDLFGSSIRIRSKNGEELPMLKEVEYELSQVFVKGGLSFCLDGEIWTPEAKFLSQITEAVRGRKGKPSPLSSKLGIYLFDIAEPGITQLDRIKILEDIGKDGLVTKFYSDVSFRVKIVRSRIIYNDAEAQAYCDECIANDFEGAVFRDMEADYQFGKRPMTMVKLKRTMDEEFEIIDVKPQDVHKDLALFVCQTKEGKPFDVTPEGTEEQKREWLLQRDELVGKLATVRFYEWTINKIPFHAVLTAIRDYE